MKRTVVLVTGAALLCAAASRGADTQTLRAIGQGKAVYLTHCAPCHGADSAGASLGTNGVSSAIPDLTRIEERDGRFDPIHVAVHIEGRPSGKCTASMPCWQQRFTRVNGQDRACTFMEIYKLTKYLEFVQGGMPTVASIESGHRR
jgi:mono/diheme cytochrome c family protein